jgi:anti-sigma factor RsiW
MSHEAERLLAAGAVLDDLDPDERAEYEAHRGTCTECRGMELELDHVMADLALVAEERVPPPDLLAGIRLALAAEVDAPRTAATAPVLLPPADSNVIPLRRASRGPMFAALAIAAGLGVVALGLGARTVTLQEDLNSTSAQVASLESSLAGQGGAMTVALNPAHVTVALHGDAIAPDAEAAVVFIPGDDASYVVARNLPATPSGHGYQLWYADAAGVHPLQTVSFDGSGTFVAPIGVDLADSTAVMLTLEESGGATDEPGPQVVFGEL